MLSGGNLFCFLLFLTTCLSPISMDHRSRSPREVFPCVRCFTELNATFSGTPSLPYLISEPIHFPSRGIWLCHQLLSFELRRRRMKTEIRACFPLKPLRNHSSH
uniref:Secreted protein n=1 Tax=Pelusios castaneus TaxID=367368 RepID=A0A8C8SGT3_9SAUR